jgi:hypothetical protein
MAKLEMALNAERVDRGFAAYTATRAGVKMSLEAGKINWHVWRQFYASYVAARAAGLDPEHLRTFLKHSFRVKKAYRELIIVPRGAHGDGDAFPNAITQWPILEANLERFFHRKAIVYEAGLLARYSPDRSRGNCAAHGFKLGEERHRLLDSFFNAPEERNAHPKPAHEEQ